MRNDIRIMLGMAITMAIMVGSANGGAGEDLGAGFDRPPVQSRVRAYWWWLNGNVTKASITGDLEAMKDKGFC